VSVSEYRFKDAINRAYDTVTEEREELIIRVFMREVTTLKNMSCPHCFQTLLSWSGQTSDLDAIVCDAIQCAGCSASFPTIYGVPYLGYFEKRDFLSVMEIASSAQTHSVPSKADFQNEAIKNWVSLTERYCEGKDISALLESLSLCEEPSWLPFRVIQHRAFKLATSIVPFTGKTVLDVAAGTGYDSYKFMREGAHVTALEYSPILAAAGMKNVPQINWVGGSAYGLPLPSESFDIVVCNSALHHFLDIPQAMEEMLRVVKREGWMICLCDSFGPQNMSALEHAKIFDDHTSVLRGVNEQVPHIMEYLKTLRAYRDILEIRLFLSQASEWTRFFKEWPLEAALELLTNSSGGFVCIAVQKKETSAFTRRKPGTKMIDVADYTQLLNNKAQAIAALAPYCPEEYLDLDFRSDYFPHFFLINGWKTYNKKQGYREGYQRARLFFRKETIVDRTIHISLCVPGEDHGTLVTLEFFISGRLIKQEDCLCGEWVDIAVELPPSIDLRDVCTFELGLSDDCLQRTGDTFFVRALSFGRNNEKGVLLSHVCTLDSLMCEKYAQRDSLTLILDLDTEKNFEIIRCLKRYSKTLQLVVPNGQAACYQWISDIEILDEYPNRDMQLCEYASYCFDSLSYDMLVCTDNDSFELQKILLEQQPERNDTYVVFSDTKVRIVSKEEKPQAKIVFQIACRLFYLGDDDRASHYFERVLRENGASGEDKLEAAAFLIEISIRKKADTSFYVACMQDFISSVVISDQSKWYHIASVYKKLGHFSEAKELFFKVAKCAKEETVLGGAFFHLGEIFFEEGSHEKALLFLNKCRVLIPTHEKAKDYIDKVSGPLLC
jgi:ubiquinone/menaquinone biosynthesis C-methylase UbiE